MRINNFSKLVISIIISQLAGIIGSIFTTSEIPNWYSNLIKPSLNPPSWLFGPVWITLYILMGISAFLIWKNGLEQKNIKKSLSLFIIQLIFNSSWSIVFFKFHNPGLALINIIILWILILCTIISFHKISKTASRLLIPYILWVSFATYLNYAIYALN